MIQKMPTAQLLAFIFTIMLIVGLLISDVLGCIELVRALGAYGVSIILVCHAIIGLFAVGRFGDIEKATK